jgi:hypothetical protein
MDALQQQLIVEIEFWQEMIETQPVAFPPESIERMQQAMALAEHKLRLLQDSPEALFDERPPAAACGSQAEH